MASQTLPEVIPFRKPAEEGPQAQSTHVREAPHPVQVVRQKMVHLTPEELLAVLKAPRSRSARDWAMVLLAYRHGLRASEVCDLKLADADLKAGSVSIRRLKGSLHTVQPLYRHKGQPLLDEVAAVRAWLRNASRTALTTCSYRRRAAGCTAANSSVSFGLALKGPDYRRKSAIPTHSSTRWPRIWWLGT